MGTCLIFSILASNCKEVDYIRDSSKGNYCSLTMFTKSSSSSHHELNLKGLGGFLLSPAISKSIGKWLESSPKLTFYLIGTNPSNKYLDKK